MINSFGLLRRVDRWEFLGQGGLVEFVYCGLDFVVLGVSVGLVFEDDVTHVRSLVDAKRFLYITLVHPSAIKLM